MTIPTFVPGYSQGTTFVQDGQSPATALDITSWSWEEAVKALITTHSGSGGVEALIAGVLSGSGTVEANFDAANIVHAGTNAVRAGVKGTVTYAAGTTSPFSIHVMVEKIDWKSQVDNLVTYNFQVKLDSSSGSYTRAS